jgi:AcrR family transcriptional regulator
MNRRTAAIPERKPKGETEMREAILKTASDLIRRYGWRKTTMEDIASAMGKRKSFLYYYFPGKAEVFSALVEKESLEIRHAMRAAVGAADNPADRVRAYFFVRSEQIVQRLSENEDFSLESLPGAETINILQLTEDRRRFDEDEVRYLADLIMEGVRAKVFRSLTEVQVQTFCQFTLSALRGTELELLLTPALAKGMKERAEVSLDVLFHGLLR